MAEEVDNFLEHYGVAGMKWGKRKAAQIKSASKQATKGLRDDIKNNPREAKTMARIKSENAVAKDRLAKSGGSKALANTKIAGRTVAIGLLANVAGNIAMNALGSNPSARAAVAIGTNAVKAANMIVGTRDIINVSIQPSKK